MSDAIDTYVNKRQRQAASNSSYAQELGQVYLNNGVEIDLDYVINENANPPQTPELSESEMITDPNWIYASKELYNAFKPLEIDQTQLAPEDIGMETFAAKAPATDAEFAAWGLEFTGMLEHNLGNLAIRTAAIPDMTDAQKISMGYMLDQFGKLPMFSWSGTKRFFKGVISDPTTWASLGTFPLLTQLGKAGAKRVTKEGLQTAIRTALSPNAIAAYEGGGYTGAFDYLKQSAIVAGEQAAGNTEAAIDPVQTGLSAAAGAALGPVLQEGIPMAAGAAVRGGQRVASATGDAIQKLAQAAKTRQAERKSGFTLRSGVDPSEVADAALAALAKRETPDVDQDNLGFYSRLLEASKNIKQKKATPDQMRAQLKAAGVKDAEIDFVIGDLLAQKKEAGESVTLDELVEYATDNRIELKEIELSQNAEATGEGDFNYSGTSAMSEDDEIVRETVMFGSNDIFADVNSGSNDYDLMEILVQMNTLNPGRYPEKPVFQTSRDATGWDVENALMDNVPLWQQKVMEGFSKARSSVGGQMDDHLDVQTMNDIDEAATEVSLLRYRDNPYQEQALTDSNGDRIYRIFGNDDIGFSVYDENAGRVVNRDFIPDMPQAEAYARMVGEEQGYIYPYDELDGQTEYGRYTLPGGTNYREILLSNPHSQQDYYGGHFNEPDIVAHIRVKDRVDDEGNKVLFVEEVQSDWGQAVRKAQKREARGETDFGQQNLIQQGEQLPFLKTTDDWLNVSLKRIIRYAVDNDYDRIAFTPGQVHSERYGKSKTIEGLVHRKYNSLAEVPFYSDGTRRNSDAVAEWEELFGDQPIYSISIISETGHVDASLAMMAKEVNDFYQQKARSILEVLDETPASDPNRHNLRKEFQKAQMQAAAIEGARPLDNSTLVTEEMLDSVKWIPDEVKAQIKAGEGIAPSEPALNSVGEPLHASFALPNAPDTFMKRRVQEYQYSQPFITQPPKVYTTQSPGSTEQKPFYGLVTPLKRNLFGEGHKEFYDKFLPRNLKKILKGIDKEIKIGETTFKDDMSSERYGDLPREGYDLRFDEPMRFPMIEITEKGKEVTSKGLPIMEATTGIGAATALGAAATQGQGESANAN